MREWIVPDEDLGCDGEYLNYKELIRCKECKHYVPNIDDEGGGECTYVMFELFTTPTDYCSWGAKMDEVTE